MSTCTRYGPTQKTPKWLQWFGWAPYRRLECVYGQPQTGAPFWDDPLDSLRGTYWHYFSDPTLG